jgi:hypothetical protein
MNFAESPSRIIYDYLMVSQTYTNSTFQALFLTGHGCVVVRTHAHVLRSPRAVVKC